MSQAWSAIMRAILLFIFAGIVVGSSFAGAANRLPASKPERWVNSAPLTAEALRGKVVLSTSASTPASTGSVPCRSSRLESRLRRARVADSLGTGGRGYVLKRTAGDEV